MIERARIEVRVEDGAMVEVTEDLIGSRGARKGSEEEKGEDLGSRLESVRTPKKGKKKE